MSYLPTAGHFTATPTPSCWSGSALWRLVRLGKWMTRSRRNLNESLSTLSKRATDRYTTALDLAEDLRHFLKAKPAWMGHTAVPNPATAAIPEQGRRTVRVIPKGLRSFDAKDADFFLDLLPGPRERDGLPQTIRFWKTRIEETDTEQTFRVGLIYGPSGCGKSSLAHV